MIPEAAVWVSLEFHRSVAAGRGRIDPSGDMLFRLDAGPRLSSLPDRHRHEQVGAPRWPSEPTPASASGLGRVSSLKG